MNPFLVLIPAALQAAPTIVAGVEYLKGEADSATKQQLALDSLTVLTSGFDAGDPAMKPVADELSGVLASIIKLTVAGFNVTGIFKHKPTGSQNPIQPQTAVTA